jgi:hypothetical protein
MQEATGVALLTIRAWCEDGSDHPLRAEVRIADDVAAGFRSTVTTVNADATVEAVREFLDSVLCSSSHTQIVLP